MEETPLAESGKERELAEDYERWKHQGSWFPFGVSFGGIFVCVVVALTQWREISNSRYWPFAALGGVGFLLGTLALLYDIPRRQLGKLSKAFLTLGLLVSFSLIVLKLVSRF